MELLEASSVRLPNSEGEEDENKLNRDNIGEGNFIDLTDNEYIEHDFDYVNPEIAAEPVYPEVQEPQGQNEESEWDQGNTSEELDWQEARDHQDQFKEPARIQAQNNVDTQEARPAVEMDWQGHVANLTVQLIGYELTHLAKMLGDYSPDDL